MSRERQGLRECREQQVHRDSQVNRDNQDNQDSRDSRDPGEEDLGLQDSRDKWETRQASKEVPSNEALARTWRPKENLVRQGHRVLLELQDSRVSQDSRVNLDSRDSRVNRDSREVRDHPP